MTWNTDRLLGLFFLVAALLIVFLWVPLDTGTGLAEKVRRRWVIGDALAPTVAGGVIALGALLTILRPASEPRRLTREHLKWLFSLFLLFLSALVLMRYLGPLAAAVLSEDGYRPLRASAPWKFIGYLAGGTALVFGLCALVRGRLNATDLVVAVVASLLIALAYDLPFEDLLLPPNGDI